MIKKILLIEDEVAIQNILKNYLVDAGYEVVTSDDGLDGFTKFQKDKFHLIMLDIMMPKIDGYAVLEMIRNTSDIPVIMITAMSEMVDQIRAFELKADDFISKPFDMPLVLARVNALMRRINIESLALDETANTNLLIHDKLTLDIESMDVYEEGKLIHLTQKEFEILKLLLMHKKKVFTREMLLEQLWGYDFFGNAKVINVHIQNLRKKLQTDIIVTVRGVGYKIDEN